MGSGKILGIFISPWAGAEMKEMQEVVAKANSGLIGDRYFRGHGSWNENRPGERQVTLINGQFFPGSGFEFSGSRRNFITENIELMRLIGQTFQVDEAVFRGVKYCDPCNRPSVLAGQRISFKKAFSDRGGLIAEIIKGGVIRRGGLIVPLRKDY